MLRRNRRSMPGSDRVRKIQVGRPVRPTTTLPPLPPSSSSSSYSYSHSHTLSLSWKGTFQKQNCATNIVLSLLLLLPLLPTFSPSQNSNPNLSIHEHHGGIAKACTPIITITITSSTTLASSNHPISSRPSSSLYLLFHVLFLILRQLFAVLLWKELLTLFML